MRTILALFLFMGLAILPSQAQFNKYKYFVVPKHFDIFKQVNQYQSSTLVKYLLTNYGYETLYDDAIPEELFWNKCLGVTAQLEDNSTFLQTKVAVVFKDCKGREVYRTPEGTSKKKEYKAAFAESIQEAMEVMAIIKYEYDGPEPKVPSESNGDIPSKELADAGGELTPPPVAETATTVAALDPEETVPVQSPEEAVAVESPEETVQEEAPSMLWSEAINEHGYVLSHLTSGESWVLMRTSNDGVYLAYSQNKQGIAFKLTSGWKLEYYLGDDRQEIQIQTRDQ